MAEHQARRSFRKRLSQSALVLIVCIIAGTLISLNISMNHSATTAVDTASLLDARNSEVTGLQKSVVTLSKKIEDLKKTLTSDPETSDPETSDSASSSNVSPSGTVSPAVEGPGIQVTLSDSPLWQDTQGVGLNGDTNVNDYVVHQQDLEGVINALWAGGAEVMMIQDQRVLPTTAVRCIGNVLLLEGKQYAPPYIISAIGPINDMLDSLDSSEAIAIYKQYVRSIGLGWDMQVKDKLEFPAAPTILQTLQYARLIK